MTVEKAALWGIILAGGEGERLKGFVREHVGLAVPKQFCAFVGRRSMLERTVRRARFLIPSERLVVIGTAHHEGYIYRALGVPLPGTVLLQPTNCDTVSGIALPLIYILRKDPHALVAILPSDHFILPGRRFMRAVSAAAQFVEEKQADCPVLLAVKPNRPESEYGWIEPGDLVEHDSHQPIRQITRFVEKPSHDRAERLLKEGWLWNTMVIVVRARVLMDLIWKHVPDVAARFAILQRFLGSVGEQAFIKAVYHVIPKINFSTSILGRRDTRSLVLPVENIHWSDWGTKERIFDDASALGLTPSVSVRTLQASAPIQTEPPERPRYQRRCDAIQAGQEGAHSALRSMLKGE